MKLKNRLKRVTDILEKLGVASLAIGLFQNNQVGLWWGIGCLLASVALTREDMWMVWTIFGAFVVALTAYGFYLARKQN